MEVQENKLVKMYDPNGDMVEVSMTDSDIFEMMGDGLVGECVKAGISENSFSKNSSFLENNVAYNMELSKIWNDPIFKKATDSFDEPKNFGTIKGRTNYPKDHRYYLSTKDGSIIEPLVKHLNYRLAHALFEMKEKYGAEEFEKFFQQFMILSSEDEVLMTLILMYNIQESCQLNTEKLISDEALFTTQEGFEEVGDIPWFLDQVIEFFFNCPDLPTLIAYRGDITELPKFFGLNKLRFQLRNESNVLEPYEKDTITFFGQTASGRLAKFTIDSKSIKSLLDKDCANFEINNDDFRMKTASLSEDDFEAITCVIRICLKSMIHAHAEPTSLERNPSKASIKLGKPNVKGRPDGKKLRVIYVPRTKSVKSNKEPTSTRNFYGRCATQMYFRADRYAKSGLQGTFKIIPPILGRNGENPHEKRNTIYRNRKIEKGFPVKSS